MQFTRYEDMSEEERAFAEEMGRRGQVIVREQKRPVSGLGRLMPKAAAAEVEAGIPFVFNVSHFIAARKRKGVRPSNGDLNPDRTNSDFCEYDEPTKTYRYTRAYGSHLIKKCSTEKGFEDITGVTPRPKPSDDVTSARERCCALRVAAHGFPLGAGCSGRHARTSGLRRLRSATTAAVEYSTPAAAIRAPAQRLCGSAIVPSPTSPSISARPASPIAKPATTFWMQRHRNCA